MLSVVVDTNFLTIPAQFGIDIFSESEGLLEGRVEFILLSSILQEIREKIEASPQSKEMRQFRVALDLSRHCRLVEVDHSLSKLSVDDQLLEYVMSVSGVLATNDRELRSRARAQGVPVIFLRGKKRLAIEGNIE
ncbi:MAG: PIN domain-containing protein [Candidatus Hodarchaeota archaeon]